MHAGIHRREPTYNVGSAWCRHQRRQWQLYLEVAESVVYNIKDKNGHFTVEPG